MVGGRYNSLVKDLGGPDTPAIGCAFGLERLLAALDAEGIDLKGIPGIDLFLIPIGEEAKSLFNSCLPTSNTRYYC